MPTYDYECEKGHKYAVQQGIKDEPFTQCVFTLSSIQVPKVESGEKVNAAEAYQSKHCGARCWRVPSKGTGFIFKGPGFFRNDYPKGT
jgi:predicted nucleic acid-binding Zn ribbon protein